MAFLRVAHLRPSPSAGSKWKATLLSPFLPAAQRDGPDRKLSEFGLRTLSAMPRQPLAFERPTTMWQSVSQFVCPHLSHHYNRRISCDASFILLSLSIYDVTLYLFWLQVRAPLPCSSHMMRRALHIVVFGGWLWSGWAYWINIQWRLCLFTG